MSNFTQEQLAALSPNDRKEALKFQRYLKLKQTKRGREVLRIQAYWRTYEGLPNKTPA